MVENDKAGEAAATGPAEQPNTQTELTERQQLIEQDRAGRFTGLAKLTAKQEAFADNLANGMGMVESARQAGYTQPHTEATRARRTPAVAARVTELLRRRIQRGAALSVKLIEDIITGKIEAPASVRLDAAKHVQRVAGIDNAGNKDNETKGLRSMTLAELEALAHAFREKAGGTIAPNVPGDGAQVIEGTVESTT